MVMVQLWWKIHIKWHGGSLCRLKSSIHRSDLTPYASEVHTQGKNPQEQSANGDSNIQKLVKVECLNPNTPTTYNETIFKIILL